MTHRIRITLLAAGTALAALASPGIALAQTKLIGTVADPGTITLRTEAGAEVTDVPAGTYTIEVVAPVARLASATVLKIGTLCAPCSNTCPPLPGVTPPTTFV